MKWAHPDFGNAFATIIADNKVVVYKEKTVTSYNEGNDPEKKTKWETIYEKNGQDNDTIIQDLKFVPKHLGYALSILYKNGYVEVISLAE